MKKIFIIATIVLNGLTSFSQTKDADAVKSVLKQYNSAIEKLDATGTQNLFTTDSKYLNQAAVKETMHII